MTPPTGTMTIDSKRGAPVTAAPAATVGSNNDDINCSDVTFKTIAFNAKGFKQSHVYISKILSSCDIIAISETWLRPGELPIINEILGQDKDICVIAKSSMCDVDPGYSGRPFGGLAMVAVRQPGLTYEELVIDNDRIIAMKVCHGNAVLQIVISVYMPFYSGDRNHTEQYVETLDMLQTVIDTYGAVCPFYIIGDFNVQLPNTRILNDTWYKRSGYNKHSRIVYDFICDNNMSALDLNCEQTMKYTYFCHTSSKYTWIDHCLGMTHDESVISCKILSHDPDNTSDHVPLCLETKLRLHHAPNNRTDINQSLHIPTKWSDQSKVSMYKQILLEKLTRINCLPVNLNHDNAQELIDHQLSCINKAIHDSTIESGCVPKVRFRPKPYWNPDLSYLRDRKRFWWRIWVDNNRPRVGVIYDIYKSVKKEFRRLSRSSFNSVQKLRYGKLDRLLGAKKMPSFWNELKKYRRSHVSSDLKPEDFRSFYENIMTDTGNRCVEQKQDEIRVKEYAAECLENKSIQIIDPLTVSDLIDSLPSGKSPGVDGITIEHLQFGKSETLCELLSNLYSVILSYCHVPTVFHTGVIIPIIKKSSLNPNLAKNYRPVTLSSLHSKFIELLLVPSVNINDNQFGFREGRGTSMACNLLSDISSHCKYQNNPLYIASLDAEKCFDSVCHVSLFVKLIGIIPARQWLLLYNWYNNLNALVKWNGHCSEVFHVTRGTRQGSILSPYLFNIFINGLLNKLQSLEIGVMIGKNLYNSFAYADDISLFAVCVNDLQKLIDVCVNYSIRWRFKFNTEKSKCLISGKCPFVKEPNWFMSSHLLKNVDQMEILGNIYNTDNTCTSHVENRINKCRQSFYGLSPAGMLYPGASADVQAYLFKHICQPTLLYGLDCMKLSRNDFVKLESVQGKLIKQSLGLSKRSHNTQLLAALNIHKVEDIVINNTLSLFHRICQSPSPTRTLVLHDLSQYILYGRLINGTILSKVVEYNQSPIRVAVQKCKIFNEPHNDGHIDSLRHLLQHENFVKPYSESHYLVHLLTTVF